MCYCKYFKKRFLFCNVCFKKKLAMKEFVVFKNVLFENLGKCRLGTVFSKKKKKNPKVHNLCQTQKCHFFFRKIIESVVNNADLKSETTIKL